MKRVEMIIRDYTAPFVMNSPQRVDFMTVREILKGMGHKQ